MRKRYVWRHRRSSTKRSLNSESATGCSQIELAIRSTRFTKPRRKIILGTIKLFEKLWWNLHYRKSGAPLSAVEQQSRTRENKVAKLIGLFENHQHKESFLQDLSQTQMIKKFSKESQDLIADMNNTEIFELCENSSKQQCPDCNIYWEIGIIYWSCGRNMKSSQSPTEFEQNNLNPCLRLQEKTAVVRLNTDLLNDKECTVAR